MKLRIRGDSLRVRVTQDELAALGRGEAVMDALHFGLDPADALRCEVSASESAPALDATFDARTIRVAVPAAAVARLVATDEVGVSGERPLGDGRTMAVLLEKDFRCLVPRPGEDGTGAFDRPDDALAGRDPATSA